MKNIILCVFIFILNSCVSFTANTYDAFVSHQPMQSNVPVYSSVQAAINAAPQYATKPYRIFIAKGEYREKITITKNNVQLIGASQQQTRLVYGDYAGKLSNGTMLSTLGSFSLAIRAQNILIENLTVENDFDFLTNDALANNDPQKITGTQAVALFIDVPSDKILVRHVSLLGYQDTLFINSGRSWFDRSFVAGNVDYIFGGGNSLFTHSEIKTLGRAKSSPVNGYITAPSTQIANAYGFTFLNCRLTREKSVSNNSTPLGRPWHPTTQFNDGRYADPNAVGKSVFMYTWMDAHVTFDGWASMSGTAKEGGRKIFLPENARFFEYMSTGPGGTISSKRRQLADNEVKKYIKKAVLGDWLL